jgi:hypothetical protein
MWWLAIITAVAAAGLAGFGLGYIAGTDARSPRDPFRFFREDQ